MAEADGRVASAWDLGLGGGEGGCRGEVEVEAAEGSGGEEERWEVRRRTWREMEMVVAPGISLSCLTVWERNGCWSWDCHRTTELSGNGRVRKGDGIGWNRPVLGEWMDRACLLSQT